MRIRSYIVVLGCVSFAGCSNTGDPSANSGDLALLRRLSDAGPACGWTPYNDGLSGALIADVLFDTRAQPTVVYATGGNAIYASGDGGHSWQTRGTFSGGIGLLAAPGQDPSLLLASSDAGVIKSTDAGRTWSVISLDGVATSSIAGSSNAPLRVYAGVPGAGIFRSDDGAGSWSAANEGFPYADPITLDVAPDNPDEVIAVGPLLNDQNGWSSDGAIVRTVDGGKSWHTVVSGDGIVMIVRRCQTDPTVLYAATTKGVTRSVDRGSTWTLLPLPGGSAEDVEINPLDCNDIYAMALGDGPHHSTDGANTFGPTLTTGLDLAQLGTWPGRMAVDPQRPGGVVLGSHGGIWYTTDSGSRWNMATGVLGLPINSLSVSPLDPTRLWLTSWGSGVWERSSANQPWQRVPLSSLPIDYAFVAAADPFTAKRTFIGGWSQLYQSDDGVAFHADPLEQNEQAIAFDGTNKSVIYAATELNGVYKSTDGGATWSASNGGLPAWDQGLGANVIDVGSIVVDPASASTLYIGTNGRGVYKSVDGAQSWSSVLAPAEVIRCLLAAPGSSTAVYACVRGSGIRESTDGGKTWVDISSGLPSLDPTNVVRDEASGNLYAADGPGVFVRRGNQRWTDLGSACLPGSVSALAIVGATSGGRRSLAAAAGGGVYIHTL